nr:immunoglobulin heavy chain junction region [Macaca mulatta]MOV40175.1 immunoglobulin heavy chain junction region [Macaca mulatta]MOV40256.1 immunoglobulin heavy chain junction region [Macaca mulatta]MOV40560.1 immunoglobulin heavy chain junction region [Macaca mulatta]MOV42138.1 immunoglobulin heavy chain junction region [Macaca mulatta]
CSLYSSSSDAFDFW